MEFINGFGKENQTKTMLDLMELKLVWLGQKIADCFKVDTVKKWNDELENAQKTITSTGSALRRTVTQFDQLNRLNRVTGSGSASKKMEEAASTAQSAQASLAERLSQIGEVAKRLRATFEELGFQFTDSAQKGDLAAQGILSIWSGLVGSVSENVAQPIVSIFQKLWQDVDISSKASIAGVKQSFAGGSGWFADGFATPVKTAAQTLWDSLKTGSQGAFQAMQQSFGGTASYFGSTFSDAWSQVQQVFSKNGQVFQGVQGGILSSFTAVVNSLIDGINQVVCVPFQGLNGILNTLNLLSILGIKPFSWLSWRAPLPQIPHLAKGAVLPANQPFLAMVGDQRHGTNIEAPLTTIQEAVATVMEDMAQGNMAGHEATVATLQQILDAVLGIRIGDEQIGAANARYQRRVGLVTGGVL